MTMLLQFSDNHRRSFDTSSLMVAALQTMVLIGAWLEANSVARFRFLREQLWV